MPEVPEIDTKMAALNHLARVLIALAVAFGLNLDPEQMGLLAAAFEAVLFTVKVWIAKAPFA